MPAVSNGVAKSSMPTNVTANDITSMSHQFSMPKRFASTAVCILNAPSTNIKMPIAVDNISIIYSDFLIIMIPSTIETIPSARSNWNASWNKSFAKYPDSFVTPYIMRNTPYNMHIVFSPSCGMNNKAAPNAIRHIVMTVYAFFTCTNVCIKYLPPFCLLF